MLEANTFRSMMLVCGVFVLSILIACFFVAPLVPIDDQAKTNYENVMHADLGDAEHLTGYQALMFTVQGNNRGNVRHY